MQASNAGRKAANQKQFQDRVFQANSAGYEIKNIDKQMLSAKIRIDISAKEIAMQQQSMDQAREVDEFLRSKYSSQQLYSWMETTTRALHYQTYTYAYGLAKKAEQVFRLERPLEADQTFIQPGYWDSSRDGLLAGEQLYLGLKKLESAYMDSRGYDFELSKSISLRQVNPLALLRLRETGSTEFTIPEILFDMDFPGHYMRKIQSVAVTIPCIVGPYTSVNATLRLQQHRYRVDPTATTGSDYGERTSRGGKADSRFSTCNVPISAVALCTGQSDAGVFELDFRGERYMPFEGAGCLSTWLLELPPRLRQFDYATMTDVVLHMRYTAVNGGDALKGPAADHTVSTLQTASALMAEQGVSVLYDVKSDFATEWHKAVAAGDANQVAKIRLSGLDRRPPIYTAGMKVDPTQISLLCDADMATTSLVEIQTAPDGAVSDGKSIAFSNPSDLGGLQNYTAKVSGMPLGNWELRANRTELAAVKKLWLVIKFKLVSSTPRP
jgi:hypothetical protein